MILAAGLRFSGLSAQSFWLDEGMTVFFINLPLDRLLQVTFVQEPNPPLYYLLLWVWVHAFGEGEAAIRALSALFGTLCIPVTFALASDLGGRRAGWLAALAALASPFLLWYSQEARAFALLAFLAALLLYLTHQATQSPRRRLLAVWALTAALTCYTHIYGAFAVGACTLALLVAGRARIDWRAGTAVIPVALFAPWMVATLIQSAAARGWRAPVGPDELVARALATVAHNEVFPDPLGPLAVLVLGGAALIGLASTRRSSAWLLGLNIGVPLLCAYGLSFFKPIFAERYIIPIAIPLYVAAAIGMTRLAGRLRGLDVAAGIAVVALLVSALAAWQQPRFEKENFRAAADRVIQSATTDDVVVFVAEFTEHPFEYYYHGPGQLVGFFGDHKDPGPFLTPIIGKASTVWLLESHWDRYDPDHNVRRWLEDRYPLVTEAFPQGIHLRAFRVRSQVDAPPSTARPITASYGGLMLTSVEFPESTSAHDEHLHPPSGWLPVTMYWQAVARLPTNYKLVLDLADARGVWGRSLLREGDLFAKVPTSTWTPGQTMIESTDLNLNPATPPGRYILQLAVLDEQGNPVTGEQRGTPLNGPLTLGEVEVRG